jgi:hypothetical protein
LPLRPQILLFFLCWLTFGWFHQGGGWNQNARFAEVRAIVEEGRFAIDNFLVYRPTNKGLQRETLQNAEFTRDGEVYRLCWPTPLKNTLVPVNGRALKDRAIPVIIGKETSSGDIGYGPDGHFHPNKPPGTSLLAVPVYFAAFHLERALGLNPDDRWMVNVNAWLCSIFTVGLLSALGVVLLWRIGAAMFPNYPNAALGAAVTFGLGTTFFPFATLLFDHNLTAAFLLASFGAVRRDRPIAAGLLAGIATLTNYLAAIPGIAFGVWALTRNRAHAWRYIAGVIPPAVGLLAYNTFALGSPLTLNTSFQNPMFVETAPAFLGMFTLPSWFAAHAITFSPWRGLFILSPVFLLLLISLIGWSKELRPERRLIIGIAAFFFLINISFNGFHAGLSAGPRYLIPALPFLCLGLIPAFAHLPRLSTLLASISIAQQTLLTATDALNPVGVSDHAWQNHPDEWKEKLFGNSLIFRYAGPLFFQGRAWPVIRAEFQEFYMPSQRDYPWEELKKFRAWKKTEEGSPDPILLAAMPGPVSVNVMDATEGTYFQNSKAHSPEANWAAFNAGEFIWPQDRLSLLLLGGIWLIAVFGVVFSRRKQRPNQLTNSKKISQPPSEEQEY